MINLLHQNWEIILAVVITPIAWFFGKRQKERVDTFSAIQTIYTEFLNDFKEQVKEYKQEIKEVKDHNHQLQLQFNAISLSYAKEVEVSQNWEKLYTELLTKHNLLKKDFENLKWEFNEYQITHP